MEAACDSCGNVLSDVMKIYTDHAAARDIDSITRAAAGCSYCESNLFKILTISSQSQTSQQPLSTTSGGTGAPLSTMSGGSGAPLNSTADDKRMKWSSRWVNVVLESLSNFRDTTNRLPRAADYQEIFESSLPKEYLEGDRLRSKIGQLKRKCDKLHRRKKKLRGVELELYNLMISVWPH
ncbi:hypothetical protein PVAP13_7NG086613 [Panicum virgatum]|uniref:Uncharacterized protein n=1 Tax=Panicum virgatum TaxID=38727 RepID=A0A8T0PTY7_PANVG|nr:hypothetical protein PVAP13_7NG086613 [Panicum virgatum]